MRLPPSAILAAILMASLPISSRAEPEERNTCPPKIMVIQTVSSETHEGWSDYGTRDEHPLVGVSFSYGPPDQKALLAPSREIKKGKNTISTWILPKSDTDYWVSCEYAGTSAVVAKPLSKNKGICTVEHDSRFSTPIVKNWGCYSSTPLQDSNR